MNNSLDSATEPLTRLLCFWFAFSSYILSGSRQSRIFILQGFIKVSISDLLCNLNRKQLALSFASDISHYCPHHCHHHFHQNGTHCASVTLAWAAVMLSGIFFSCCLWVICRRSPSESELSCSDMQSCMHDYSAALWLMWLFFFFFWWLLEMTHQVGKWRGHEKSPVEGGWVDIRINDSK